jgi:predicted transcriptional regulator
MTGNTNDFCNVSRLCRLIAKDYAKSFFKLLATYTDISASEAASRLNIHIKTAQDFLEGLEGFGICTKREVVERKRPYFRYTLTQKELSIHFNLCNLLKSKEASNNIKWRIRERKNSGAIFKTMRGGNRISFVQFFIGDGRSRVERKLNLTNHQGLFLYHLPFPTKPFSSVEEVIAKAQIDKSAMAEILDIVEVLVNHGIIEKQEHK